ncbi:hypothetical protein CRM22_001049 [Opisthorchis felineus]|uniref:AAA+ ATPase domain-containing protein n=1 Tax=Opisthorchis felineus TaxID=147828 RepID=A0A4V6RH81_OPIFE|nr:hypothetical protein CRM22_001049 [Opisthorchis felineus]
MEHLIRLTSKHIPIPRSFHLTSASVCRPLTRNVPSITGLFTLSAASVGPSDSLTGCVAERYHEYFPAGFTLEALIKHLRNWWDGVGPEISPQPPKIPVDISSSWKHPKLSVNHSHIDYVRLIQLLISLVGIGLSLKLLFYVVEQINPTAKEKRIARKRAQQLFAQMGIKTIPPLNDYEVGIVANLVDTRVLSTEWHSIGGLDSVIDEIKESVIAPFQQLQLVPYFSKLLRPPKGVLLFGPPGCGKTMLARAMARQAKAYFINLQISTLVNMWYGETQKYVEATFSLAHKLQPSIIFIDELDSFLTTRSCTDNESTRMIKTQFMALWDGLLTEENTRILIVGATNRPQDLDQAILRRLPYKVSVPMPDINQRIQILSICLRGEPLAIGLTDTDIREVASKTDGLSGSDLNELCREAAFCCYRLERSRENAVNMRLRREHFFTALQIFLRNRVCSNPYRVEQNLPVD